MNFKDYKIILDTDIGDDIDDAFALGVALKTNCDLVAVTTVFKNTIARSKQAAEMVSLAHLNIPIYAGEVYPLNGKIVAFEMDQGDPAKVLPCQYDDGMEQYKIGFNAPQEIVKLAKTYKNKLVIVTIGPLTNLAKALELDNSIKDDIAAVFDMGGNYSKVQPEWNVLCDVEAYEKVFQSHIPFYGVGLDMTMKCPLDGDLFVKLRESNDALTKKIFVWFDRWVDYFHFEKSVLHDPLTICSLIDSDICTFKEKYVKVITDGEMRSAIEVCEEPKDGFNRIYAAVSVDKERFYDLIKKLFS